MEDISDRRRAEEDLLDSVRSFETVTQSVNDAVVSAGEDGTIAFWNDAARSIFGYEPEDILGRELTALMPERFHQLHRDGFARYLGGGESPLLRRPGEPLGPPSDGRGF